MPEETPPTLQRQLEEFAAVGLTLNPGITIDDVEYSFSSDDYEAEPYSLLFFALGIEVERAPWGRRMSNRVWNFDLESIEGPGSYKQILENLSALTGRPGLICEIDDTTNLDGHVGQLSYRIDGIRRSLAVRVQDDWADANAVSSVLRDIEQTLNCGGRFWSADNGQAVILTFLTDAEAARINALSESLLSPA